MRQDLAKVICEDGRRGPRGYMGHNKGYARKRRFRVAEDRNGDDGALDYLPRHESMTARLQKGGRWFSENLGALRGLISSSCGESWDALYGELCRLVSPTGTNVQRHVHQHLDDVIVRQTRMGERGVEACRRGRGTWAPVEAVRTRQDYLVHPLTRTIARFTTQRMPSSFRSGAPALVIHGPQPHLRYIQLRGFWYRFALERAAYVPRRHGPRHRRRIRREDPLILVQADQFTLAIAHELPSAFFDFRLHPRPSAGASEVRRLRIAIFGEDLVPISKRSLTQPELRAGHLANSFASASAGFSPGHVARRNHH